MILQSPASRSQFPVASIYILCAYCLLPTDDRLNHSENSESFPLISNQIDIINQHIELVPDAVFTDLRHAKRLDDRRRVSFQEGDVL